MLQSVYYVYAGTHTYQLLRVRVPMSCVRRVVQGVLYASNARIVRTSVNGHADMMAVVAAVFAASGLTSSKMFTETVIFRAPALTTLAPPLVVESVRQKNRETTRLLYMGGMIHESADVSLEIE